MATHLGRAAHSIDHVFPLYYVYISLLGLKAGFRFSLLKSHYSCWILKQSKHVCVSSCPHLTKKHCLVLRQPYLMLINQLLFEAVFGVLGKFIFMLVIVKSSQYSNC